MRCRCPQCGRPRKPYMSQPWAHPQRCSLCRLNSASALPDCWLCPEYKVDMKPSCFPAGGSLMDIWCKYRRFGSRKNSLPCTRYRCHWCRSNAFRRCTRSKMRCRCSRCDRPCMLCTSWTRTRLKRYPFRTRYTPAVPGDCWPGLVYMASTTRTDFLAGRTRSGMTYNRFGEMLPESNLSGRSGMSHQRWCTFPGRSRRTMLNQWMQCFCLLDTPGIHALRYGL